MYSLSIYCETQKLVYTFDGEFFDVMSGCIYEFRQTSMRNTNEFCFVFSRNNFSVFFGICWIADRWCHMPRVSKNRFGSWRCFSVLFLEVKVAMWGCCLGCVALFETMPNSWMLLLRGTWEATQLLKVLTKNALFGFD